MATDDRTSYRGSSTSITMREVVDSLAEVQRWLHDIHSVLRGLPSDLTIPRVLETHGKIVPKLAPGVCRPEAPHKPGGGDPAPRGRSKAVARGARE